MPSNNGDSKKEGMQAARPDVPENLLHDSLEVPFLVDEAMRTIQKDTRNRYLSSDVSRIALGEDSR